MSDGTSSTVALHSFPDDTGVVRFGDVSFCGQWAWTLSEFGTCCVYRLKHRDFVCVCEFDFEENVRYISCGHHQGNLCLLATLDGCRLDIWALEGINANSKWSVDLPNFVTCCIAVQHGGENKIVFAGTTDGHVVYGFLNQPERFLQAHESQSAVSSLAFDSQAQTVAIGLESGEIVLVSIAEIETSNAFGAEHTTKFCVVVPPPFDASLPVLWMRWYQGEGEASSQLAVCRADSNSRSLAFAMSLFVELECNYTVYSCQPTIEHPHTQPTTLYNQNFPRFARPTNLCVWDEQFSTKIPCVVFAADTNTVSLVSLADMEDQVFFSIPVTVTVFGVEMIESETVDLGATRTFPREGEDRKIWWLVSFVGVLLTGSGTHQISHVSAAWTQTVQMANNFQEAGGSTDMIDFIAHISPILLHTAIQDTTNGDALNTAFSWATQQLSILDKTLSTPNQQQPQQQQATTAMTLQNTRKKLNAIHQVLACLKQRDSPQPSPIDDALARCVAMQQIAELSEWFSRQDLSRFGLSSWDNLAHKYRRTREKIAQQMAQHGIGAMRTLHCELLRDQAIVGNVVLSQATPYSPVKVAMKLAHLVPNELYKLEVLKQGVQKTFDLASTAEGKASFTTEIVESTGLSLFVDQLPQLKITNERLHHVIATNRMRCNCCLLLVDHIMRSALGENSREYTPESPTNLLRRLHTKVAPFPAFKQKKYLMLFNLWDQLFSDSGNEFPESVEIMSAFPGTFALPTSDTFLIQALWCVDTGDLQQALLSLAHPAVEVGTFALPLLRSFACLDETPGMACTTKLLGLLSHTILGFGKTPMPDVDEADICLVLHCFIRCGRIGEAFELAKLGCAGRCEYFFRSCWRAVRDELIRPADILGLPLLEPDQQLLCSVFQAQDSTLFNEQHPGLFLDMQDQSQESDDTMRRDLERRLKSVFLLHLMNFRVDAAKQVLSKVQSLFPQSNTLGEMNKMLQEVTNALLENRS